MSEMRKMQWKMDFVINISESDYILKKPAELKAFLAQSRGKNFVKSHGTNTASFVKKQGKVERIDLEFIFLRHLHLGNSKFLKIREG